MSDERQDDLLPEFDDNDEDVLLQVQMWIYNLVVGQWKKLLFVFGGILLIVLVHGLYTDSVVQAQRAVHAEVAMVKYELPEPNPMAQYGLAPMDNPNDAKRMASLTASAKELERIAAAASGSAAWFAWMDAAAVWSRANQPDAQVVALTKATEVIGEQTLNAIAAMQLANIYQETNKPEQAITVLEKLISDSGAEMKAQACLNLTRMYLDAGDVEKAKAALSQVSEAPDGLQNDILLLQAELDG